MYTDDSRKEVERIFISDSVKNLHTIRQNIRKKFIPSPNKKSLPFPKRHGLLIICAMFM